MVTKLVRVVVLAVLASFSLSLLPASEAQAGHKARHERRKERRKARKHARKEKRHDADAAGMGAAPADAAPKSE